MDIEDAWDREFNALVLHVVDLSDALAVNKSRYLSDHLNELVGDEFRLNAIPSAETHGETTHGDIYLAGLHIEPVDRLGG